MSCACITRHFCSAFSIITLLLAKKQASSRISCKNNMRLRGAAFQHPLWNLPHARQLFRLLTLFLSNPGQHASANRLVRTELKKTLNLVVGAVADIWGPWGLSSRPGWVFMSVCAEGLQLRLGRLRATSQVVCSHYTLLDVNRGRDHMFSAFAFCCKAIKWDRVSNTSGGRRLQIINGGSHCTL